MLTLKTLMFSICLFIEISLTHLILHLHHIELLRSIMEKLVLKWGSCFLRMQMTKRMLIMKRIVVELFFSSLVLIFVRKSLILLVIICLRKRLHLLKISIHHIRIRVILLLKWKIISILKWIWIVLKAKLLIRLSLLFLVKTSISFNRHKILLKLIFRLMILTLLVWPLLILSFNILPILFILGLFLVYFLNFWVFIFLSIFFSLALIRYNRNFFCLA